MCGRLDVDQMLKEISGPLFNEWVAFTILEPDPAERIIAYIIKAMRHIVASNGVEPPEVEDIMIEFGKHYLIEDDQKAQHVEVALKAGLTALAAKSKGKIRKLKPGE